MDYQQNLLASLQGGLNIGRQVKGIQDKRNINMLAGQAYGATEPAQQQSLLSQMAAIDPASAQQQQKAFASDEERRNATMVNMAKMLTSAPEQARPGLYQQMVPTLKTFGLSDMPQQYDAQTAPIINQAAQSLVAAYSGTNGASGVQSTYVDAQGNRVAIMRDGSTQILGANDAGANQQTLSIDVNGVPTQVTFDKRTGRYSNAALGSQAPAAAPTRNDMEADISLANQMIAAGIPSEQVDAFLAGRGERAGPATVAAPQGMPLTGRRAEDQAFAVETAKNQAQNANFGNRLAQETALEGVRTEGAGARAQIEAQAKDAAARPKRIQQYQQALTAAGNVEQSLSNALQMLGPTSTGFIGARSRGVEGTPAYNLAAEIETIKANLGFDRLQQMRDSSPTGGALGAIAVQELVALQSTIANLDPNQSEEQIRRNLERVKTHYANWRKAVQDAITEERAAANSSAATRPASANQASDFSNLWN